MVASSKVLNALKEIGLNLYERQLYAALLARGTSTAGELSELANVPRSRSYDVLESLAEKGFVVVQNAKPLRYVALPPGEGLERVRNKIIENADAVAKKIEELKSSDVMGEMQRLFSEGIELVQPSEITGSIKGRKLVHQQMSQMFRGAKSHISIITTHDGMNELVENHYETLKGANSAGVKIKIAAPRSNANDEAHRKLGGIADVRKLDRPNGRLCIVDNKQAIVALTDDEKTHHSQDTAFWTRSEHAAQNIMHPLFESIWSRSE